MGGAGLHFGWVAEMKTGEGKTLVSTLAVYLNALEAKGVHVITVNDYLAGFHSEWMGNIYRFLGLDVGLILPGNDDAEFKRAQYAADVTYGVNNEFGFDYLRDNMAQSRDAQVQRGHNYAIVDEIDSILIDEARTPLIISGRLADAAQLYVTFAGVAQALSRDIDYEVDEEKRNVSVLEPGIEKVEVRLGVDNLYDQVSSNLVHQLSAALRAKELYRRDKDYVIQDGEVKIVDEFTGRILDGRRWSEGLHQAVEAKEGVKIKEENQTLATITLQNYFRLYEKLCGMTGTATTEAAEFSSTYGMDVVPIPTNRPLERLDQADLGYKTEKAKFDALVKEHDMQSDYWFPGFLRAATTPAYAKRIQQALKVLAGMGVEGIEWIDGPAGRAGGDAPVFLGAGWEPPCGRLNPARQARGLTPVAAAEAMGKKIKSALHNMVSKEGGAGDAEVIVVKLGRGDEGRTLYRIRPRAQGRAFRIRTRSSHIAVVVALKEEAE